MSVQARPADPLLSIIIPAKNEADGVARLTTMLNIELASLGCRYEVILVDDGSTDETADRWRSFMAIDDRLSLVVLNRNFGKEPALLAGMAQARGDVIVPLDADLQDPPQVIRAFLDHWRAGYDHVYGVRKTRDDPLWKRISSRIFYWCIARMSHIEIPENAGDFRLLDRRLVDALLNLPEVDRFTRGLYHYVGGRTISVPYDRPAATGRPRRYRLSSSIDQAISALSFTDTPLRLVMGSGFLVALLGFLYLMGHVVAHWAGVPMAWGWPSLIAVMLCVGGMQLTAIGVVGLYLGRTYREVKRRPAYLIATVEGPAASRPAR